MSHAIPSGTFPLPRSSGFSWPHLRRQVWQWLTALEASRTRPQMEALARHYAHSNPGLARDLREAARQLLVD